MFLLQEEYYFLKFQKIGYNNKGVLFGYRVIRVACVFTGESVSMTMENLVTDELLDQAKNGDQEAVGKIFDQYKNFVFLKARNYFLMGAEKEDLIQEGMIGLLKAIRAYDKDKTASFKTFARITSYNVWYTKLLRKFSERRKFRYKLGRSEGKG